MRSSVDAVRVLDGPWSTLTARMGAWGVRTPTAGIGHAYPGSARIGR